MTKQHKEAPTDRAIAFVRLHARRDPRFAKGPDKARIIEAREIVAAFDDALPVTGDAQVLVQRFRDASRGLGRAGTTEWPGGPYMAMADAANVYADLMQGGDGRSVGSVDAEQIADNAKNTVGAGEVDALIQWARDQMALPDGSGYLGGHIDENHRYKLRDLVNAIDAASWRLMQRTRLGDLPSRIQGWVGKARSQGRDRIELDFETVDLLVRLATPATAVDAVPAAVSQAELTALDAAIAELEAFDRDGTILDEIDDWAGFCECVLLCLGELKRLRAQGDVQAKLDQYRTAWEALFGPLSWMQLSDQLTAYVGWGLSEIANDLIDRAYPGLRSSAVAAMEARGHG